MRFFFLIVFFCCSLVPFNCSLFSEHYISEDEQFHIDRFNFSSSFPDMETMEIYAQRKKRVHFDVSGDFPRLVSIAYHGSFGFLRGKLTGNYPELTTLEFSCSSCKMDLDFRGTWYKNTFITINNESEPVTLVLPRDVGVIVHTTVSTKGKVIVEGDLVKRGRGIWKKTYCNSLIDLSPVTLVFNVHSRSGGAIILR